MFRFKRRRITGGNKKLLDSINIFQATKTRAGRLEQ